LKLKKDGFENLITIIENSIEGLWILDKNANTSYVNSDLAKTFGYSKNEMIGKSLFEFMNEENVKLAKIYFNRRKKGIREEHYFKFKSKTGRLYKARMYTTPIFDKENKFLGAIAFIIELDEVKREGRYETNEITLSALLSNIMGVAYRCRNEKEWTMEFLSEGCYDLTGYPPEALLFNNELSFEELIVQEDRDKVWKEIQAALEHNQQFKISYRIRTKSGKIKWVKEKGRQIHLKNGKQVLEGYISDITREKMMEKHLKKSEEKYREAYHKAEFYKDLFTHDMNNILQSLISSLQLRKELLEKSDDEELSNELLENIEKQTLRAKKLIQNIKLMSKIKDRDGDFYKVEILKIITDLKEYFLDSMKDKNMEINIFHEEHEYKVLANNLVENIFENLILNSIIHNSNEKIIIDISLMKISKDMNKYIEIDITDNGIGIEPSRRNLIFERNFRNTKGIQGMGLGLSLIRNLIDQFNGEIQIKDRIDGDYTKGTKFTVLLPEVS
jgi:PAS domain S-box-containing protein